MNVATVHRPHVQVPRLMIIVVLAIAAAAALVMLLSIQATTTTPATVSAGALSTASAPVLTAGVPKDRSPIVHVILFGEMPAAAPAGAPVPLRKSSHTPMLAGEGASSSR